MSIIINIIMNKYIWIDIIILLYYIICILNKYLSKLTIKKIVNLKLIQIILTNLILILILIISIIIGMNGYIWIDIGTFSLTHDYTLLVIIILCLEIVKKIIKKKERKN